MDPNQQIDVTFDFRSDTPGYPKNDPDAKSPTLRRYHKALWSKSLPGGAVFDLVDTTPRTYLHHRSQLGEFWLASDAVVPTFRKEPHIARILETIPQEHDEFMRIGYTIGGMMLFPGNRVGGKMTINGARGFDRRIKDRFDLTVECIRRHYADIDSPLSDTLGRYRNFFELFRDFRGYVEFFLLQDLVSTDCSAVKFFLPFNSFEGSPVPGGIEAYRSYRSLAIAFIQARNVRIRQSRLAVDSAG